MSEDTATRSRAVGTFYDLLGMFLEAVYGDNLHYGYWADENDDSPMQQAQQRLNDELARRLGVGPGDHVIDIGCGTGGPARRIARVTGAAVTGVTLSSKQVDRAGELATAEGLTGRVRFTQADAVHLPGPDGGFDAAMFLEVLVHIPDKAAALGEAYRVLRPGGRLALAELTLLRPMTGDEQAIWSAMPMSAPPTAQRYAAQVAAAGFVVEEVSDASAHIRRSHRATRAAVERERQRQSGTYGPRVLRNVTKAVLDLQNIAESCLGYVLLTARRPG